MVSLRNPKEVPGGIKRPLDTKKESTVKYDLSSIGEMNSRKEKLWGVGKARSTPRLGITFHRKVAVPVRSPRGESGKSAIVCRF